MIVGIPARDISPHDEITDTLVSLLGTGSSNGAFNIVLYFLHFIRVGTIFMSLTGRLRAKATSGIPGMTVPYLFPTFSYEKVEKRNKDVLLEVSKPGTRST